MLHVVPNLFLYSFSVNSLINAENAPQKKVRQLLFVPYFYVQKDKKTDVATRHSILFDMQNDLSQVSGSHLDLHSNKYSVDATESAIFKENNTVRSITILYGIHLYTLTSDQLVLLFVKVDPA